MGLRVWKVLAKARRRARRAFFRFWYFAFGRRKWKAGDAVHLGGEVSDREILREHLLYEIERCERLGIEWKALVLRKYVILVPEEKRPSPDGSSLAYLELAVELARKQRAADRDRQEGSPFLAALDAQIQEEIGEALQNERKILGPLVAS
jgi:hypothetical protein